jgi:hypothetical protein
VVLAIAMNGQDFKEETSNARVTFVGTGYDTSFLYSVVGALLVALVILALVTCILAVLQLQTVSQDGGPNIITLRNQETTTVKGYAPSRAFSSATNPRGPE